MLEIRTKYALLGKDLDLYENIELQLDEKNEIIEINELRDDIKKNEILIPAFFNAHIHSADIGLRGVNSGTLEQLVGPVSKKTEHLSNMSDKQLSEAIDQSYREAISNQIFGWSDFREGQLDGLKPYPLQSSTFIPYGRPKISELENYPKFAQFGIRDVKAYDQSEIENINTIAQRNGKQIFIHASEDIDLRNEWIDHTGENDIIWSIDNYQLDAIIHATHADNDDIVEMADNNIGVITCLSSNKFTNVGYPPINEMLENNITIGIGTDNAMFSRISLWEEMKHYSLYEISSKELLKMATVNGANICGLNWGISKGNSNFVKIKLPKVNSTIFDFLASKCNSNYVIDQYPLIEK